MPKTNTVSIIFLNMLLCIFICLAVPACKGSGSNKGRYSKWSEDYFQTLSHEDYPMAIVAAARHQKIKRAASKGKMEYRFEKISQAKSMEIIRMMSRTGADLNALADGKTALIAAVQHGSADMVSLLLKYGADPLLHDNRGKTAKDYAGKHKAIARLLEDALHSIYTQHYEISDPHHRILPISTDADSLEVAADSLENASEYSMEPETLQQAEMAVVSTSSSNLTVVDTRHKPYEEAQLIGSLKPVYPASAREAGIKGKVILSVTVLPSGKAGEVMIIKGIQPGAGGLDEAAVKAVREAKFKPAKRGALPVAATIRLTVSF